MVFVLLELPVYVLYDDASDLKCFACLIMHWHQMANKFFSQKVHSGAVVAQVFNSRTQGSEAGRSL